MVLTQEQLNVLNNVVVDGQAWADHVENNFSLEQATVMLNEKVARYKPKYDADVLAGNYKTRSQEDAEAVIAEQEAYNNVPYDIKRQRAYPSIGDQLDALWKGGQDQADMKVIVDQVKIDFPKPE